MKHLTTLLATLCVAVVLYAQEPEIREEDSVENYFMRNYTRIYTQFPLIDCFI
jgi:hypothetical protein